MDTPEKLYYSISEVSEHTGVKAYVLRYWESQFSMLRPRKSRGGVRKYRPKDMALVGEIRHLLYDLGYTIAGARRKLLDERKEGKSKTAVKAEPVSGVAETGPKPIAESIQRQLIPIGADDTGSSSAMAGRKVVNAAGLTEIRQELIKLKEMLVQNNVSRENSRAALNIGG